MTEQTGCNDLFQARLLNRYGRGLFPATLLMLGTNKGKKSMRVKIPD